MNTRKHSCSHIHNAGIYMPVIGLTWPRTHNQLRRYTQGMSQPFLEKKKIYGHSGIKIRLKTYRLGSGQANEKKWTLTIVVRLILLRHLGSMLNSILMGWAALGAGMLECARRRYAGISSFVQSSWAWSCVTIPRGADVLVTTHLHKLGPYSLRVGPLQVGEGRRAGSMASLRLAVGRGAAVVRQ